MDKNGFTLIELIVIIAIIALASGFIATRFFSLTGNQQEFEDEVVAKGIAEAAYVFIDSPKNTNVEYETCSNAGELLVSGYISSDQGLLNKCDENCLNSFYFKVTKIDGEKKVDVYKNDDNCDDSNKKIMSY